MTFDFPINKIELKITKSGSCKLDCIFNGEQLEINTLIVIEKDKINCLIKQRENHINQIINEIQNRCKHNWIRECSGGPYPDKWSQCSICNKIADYRCG